MKVLILAPNAGVSLSSGGGSNFVLKQARANPSAPKWFRVVAIDASGRRAWTNPIWIDELAGG